MIDLAMFYIIPFLMGFALGFFFIKYRVEYSALNESVTLIKENIDNLTVQLGVYMNKDAHHG